MDYFTLILSAVVVAYIGYYLFGSIVLYRKWAAAESRGGLTECDGEVFELLDERRGSHKGVSVNWCYPHYRAVVGGKELCYRSVVRRSGVTVSQPATLCCEERTGLLWAKGDIGLLKRQILYRAAMMIGLVAVLILTSILL